MKTLFAVCGALALSSTLCFAHEGETQISKVRADSHAPIGVMGEHLHKTGEWMFSYRFMTMDMQDNYKGRDKQSSDSIATSEPNRFSGMPNQPPTLRVVPEDMRMDMHMLGSMYAPNDDVTIMVMLPYVEKSMDHITYQGGMGTNRLGRFTTQSSGLGDASINALLRLGDVKAGRSTLASIGLSLPSGSIDEKDQILTPMGTNPSPVLPYPMQLGSGTYDVLTGLTASAHQDRWGWGAQYAGTWRLGRNDADYSLGDLHAATAWLSHQPRAWLSVSARLRAQHQGKVDGQDSRVMAPVQTADPDRQGGQRLDAGLGFNLAGVGSLKGHRLAVEWLTPLMQDLNGPQLGTSSVIWVGYQFAL